MRWKHFNVWFFAVVLVVISALDVLGPLKGFSELENRYLAARPELSLEALFEGDYTVEYEAYVDDQFVARETWMRGKVAAERVLGKVENSGVVFGADGYLFHKFIGLPNRFIDNAKLVAAFIKKHHQLPSGVIFAPNSYAVMAEEVPFGLYNVPQQDAIDTAYELVSEAGAQTVDLLTALSESDETSLYYKLDHHWTTFGAYEAYRAWSVQRGVEPVDLSGFEEKRVPDFRGTFFSAAKRFDQGFDEIVYYEMPHAEVTIDGEVRGGLYDESFAKGKDKYGMFLYNNPGRLTIESSYEGVKGSLLVFKDSYANSFLPFLTAHFETIEVVDLRYYNGNVSELVEDGGFDEMLFLYNVVTFSEDAFVRKLR